MTNSHSFLLTLLCLLWALSPLRGEPSPISNTFAETIQTLYQAGLVPLPADAKPVSRILWRGTVLPMSVRGERFFASRWVWTDPTGETRLMVGNDIREGAVEVVDTMVGQVAPPANNPHAYITVITEAAMARGFGFEKFQNGRNTRTLSPPEALREDGHWMIFAIRLHETGYSELADQMASTLTEARGLDVIRSAARGALTEFAYDAAFQRYLSYGDLHRFIVEIDFLLENESKNWIDAALVAVLLEDWRGAEAATQQIPENLSEKQKALYQALLKIPPGISVALGSVLVQNPLLLSPETARAQLRLRQSQLNGTPEARVRAEDLTSAELLLDQLIASGPDFIPVSIALLDSAAVLPISTMNFNTHRRIEASDPGKAQAFFRLRSFPRPLKAADLAQTLLTSINPAVFSASDTELVAETTAFYNKILGKSRMEIAEIYLRGAGTFTQVPQSARNVLIQEGDETLRDEIRAKILEDPNLLFVVDAFRNTALLEGEKGEAFRLACIEKVLSIYAEQLADPANPRRAYLRSQLQQKLGWDPPAETETPR